MLPRLDERAPRSGSSGTSTRTSRSRKNKEISLEYVSRCSRNTKRSGERKGWYNVKTTMDTYTQISASPRSSFFPVSFHTSHETEESTSLSQVTRKKKTSGELPCIYGILIFYQEQDHCFSSSSSSPSSSSSSSSCKVQLGSLASSCLSYLASAKSIDNIISLFLRFISMYTLDEDPIIHKLAI